MTPYLHLVQKIKSFSNSPVTAGYFYSGEQSIFKKKYLQTRGLLTVTVTHPPFGAVMPTESAGGSNFAFLILFRFATSIQSIIPFNHLKNQRNLILKGILLDDYG